MTKYARIVFEEEIRDDATEYEIMDIFDAALSDYMNSSWCIDDIEIHEQPYMRDEI